MRVIGLHYINVRNYKRTNLIGKKGTGDRENLQRIKQSKKMLWFYEQHQQNKAKTTIAKKKKKKEAEVLSTAQF